MTDSSFSISIPSKYDPSSVEDKWYAYWLNHRFFHSKPDERPPYTIVIPPPNVTGVLHMGHMLNNTIQDVLIRKARMEGFNACWVPGTDHASIATEAKVVRKLREKGIKKSDLSRNEFMKHAWEWTHTHGGIILEQLKKLGASCDWDRTSFTMNEQYYKDVIRVFVDLFNKGHIYRGERMINWDPAAQTALSDEEVVYKEVHSKLYHIRYPVAGSDSEFVIIATTRPETILGDTAICIHPNDERYKHLHGKKAIVPLVNREIPIITDEYVDMEFGTGCLKVTPAHDVNDFMLGEKHGLDVINMMNADGTISEAGELYIGQDRFEVRKTISADLDNAHFLVKTEDYTNQVGFSERTDVPIEPRLSLQWWVAMEELSKPAFESVMNDTVQFHPSKFKNTYRHWMENIKDWCISRQLWWGQRIPAYYYGENNEHFVVAESAEEALNKIRNLTGNLDLQQEDIQQDEDVLDTWFSSWLWPISVFNGFEDSSEIDYYYPTNTLVTAPEIMFFWVARMIIAGYEFRGEKPFSHVYYNGIVRDKKGRKMSKSLGNSPDPLDLISEYGADGVRVGMLLSTPAGNDLLFDPKLCEQGRNFSNKVWNAFRFLLMNRKEDTEYIPTLEIDPDNVAERWMLARIEETTAGMNADFEQFRLNDALKKIYSLIWDDFCDWYIELIKPDIYPSKIEKRTLSVALGFFEQLMKLLHPFMPFLSEEIWQAISPRTPEQALIITGWPEPSQFKTEKKQSKQILEQFERIKKCVTAIRNIRAQANIAPKKPLDLFFKKTDEQNSQNILSWKPYITKLEKIGEYAIITNSAKPAQVASALIFETELWISMEGLLDVEAEKDKLSKEINRLQGFLKSIEGKLNTPGFVQNAPEAVLEKERKKQNDTQKSLDSLYQQLKELG